MAQVSLETAELVWDQFHHHNRKVQFMRNVRLMTGTEPKKKKGKKNTKRGAFFLLNTATGTNPRIPPFSSLDKTTETKRTLPSLAPSHVLILYVLIISRSTTIKLSYGLRLKHIIKID